MYRALNFRGDASELADQLTVTRSDGGRERTVPHLLGADAFGRAYEVLDVEVTYARDDDAGRDVAVSTVVHLAPATTETLRGHRSREFHTLEAHHASRLDHQRVAHFWRPDVYPAPPPGDVIAAGLARAAQASA